MHQIIRKNIYWSLDFIKGGKLRAHYNDIAFIMENIGSAKSNRKREQSLNKVLRHAVDSTPFYKEFDDFKGLEDFPVIDKNAIRDNYDDFKSSLYSKQQNHTVLTSGSTGTPFQVLQDKNKRIRNSADVIYFAHQAGFEIGQKLYYIRQWDKYNSPKSWIAKMKNIYIHPISNLSEPDLDNLFLDMSENKSSAGIMCYASSLDEIKVYLKEKVTKPIVKNIKSIIAISEALKEDTKTYLEKYFKVPVLSRYSNAENGILAQQLLESKEFEINWASYYIEILEVDSDAPAKPGTTGRIIITDLYNYCMPMIRYDSGDIGQFSVTEKNGTQYTTLKRVEGRKTDMFFNTSGELRSPYTVYHLMVYPHILQYQFIQESKKQYTIKLNVLPEFQSEKEVLRDLKIVVGDDAKINLEYVGGIPSLSSGKRKSVINIYKQVEHLVEQEY